MTDLRDRFQRLDRLPAPDLWSEARMRAAAQPSGSTWRPTISQPAFAVLTLVALVAMIVLGVAIAGGSRRATPPVASPTAAATSAAVPFVITGQTIVPGRYWIYGRGGPTHRLSLEIPDGWLALSAARGGGLSRGGNGQSTTLSYGPVDNVVARPCQDPAATPVLASPAIGPSVDALVAGLRSIPGFEFGVPTETRIDGRPATRLELDHPVACAGPAEMWMTAGGGDEWPTDSLPGAHTTIWIVDVDGERVAIVAQTLGASDAGTAEVGSMVDSMAFGR